MTRKTTLQALNAQQRALYSATKSSHSQVAAEVIETELKRLSERLSSANSTKEIILRTQSQPGILDRVTCKPLVSTPGNNLTTLPGESALCWVCREIFQTYNQVEGGGTIGETNENILENAEEGCCLCASIATALIVGEADSLHGRNSIIEGERTETFSISYRIYTSPVAGLAVVLKWIDQTGRESSSVPTYFDLRIVDELDVPPNIVSSSTGSVKSLDLARKWLNDCISEHKICRSLMTSFIPTRVLDIGSSGHLSSQIRLCMESEVISGSRYVTLSHCWGQISPKRLLKNNLDSMLQGFDVSELPKTFRDAICVVRQLGLRYLWIDSLCIIQDLDSDWQTESRLMTEVYSNGLFNICATAAEDGSKGLFFGRSAQEVQLPRAVVTIGGVSILRTICPSDFSSTFEGPLTRRGWVIQERLMSPANLHFVQKQLVWECHEKLICESFISEVPQDIPRFRDPFSILLQKVTRPLEDAGSDFSDDTQPLDGSFIDSWTEIIHRYTDSELTYRTDKLIAIGGLARFFHSRVKSEYFAGLWRNQFEDQLLWIKVPEMKRAEILEYVAPSWSWAAAGGPCRFEKGSYEFGKTQVLLDILDINVESLGDSVFGQVTSGFLKAYARLAKAQVKSGEFMKVYQFNPLHSAGSSSSSRISDLEIMYESKTHMDLASSVWRSEDHNSPAEEAYLLPIRETKYPKGVDSFGKAILGEVLGLILKPTSSGSNVFTRQGLFTIFSYEWPLTSLNEGFRYFDSIADESGFEYIESLTAERKYLIEVR